jgi:hypothetical protein
MRRLVMMIGLVMMLGFVAAGVALAVTKTCGDNLPCRGTDNDDVLHERVGNHKKDHIMGLKGNDDIEAALFTKDRDRVDGGPGRDRILVNDGDARDVARGGRGRDVCFVDQGDGRRSCERVEVESAGAIPAGFGTTADESTDSGERAGQE